MSSDNAQENIRLPPKWIVVNINKRECSTFISMPQDPTLCQCGRRKIDHGDFVKFNHRAEKWSPLIHSKKFPTDAYGTILFEGEHHPNKAHYARLCYDTNPELVMHMLRYVWGLPLPKLVVTVHGGSLNFDLPSRLGKIFQNGMLKVAHTTSAWVISSGLNSGVSKHLGNALNNRWFGDSKRRHVVSIGIAPWGMCEHRNELIGRNKDRVYSPLEIHNSSMIHLNPRHSNFLLVDNGSIGRFGGETFLRRKLEKCICTYPISQNGHCGSCSIPVVAIILEGGGHTLRLISEYLYDDPPIPIILFAGSGKITDLVAWMLSRFTSEDEMLSCYDEVMSRIDKIFHIGAQASSEVFQELKQIYQRKILITVYNGNSANEEEFDTVILASIFRNQHRSPLEQLALTMVWDRVDLAQTEVFVYGREWSRDHLETAMMEALICNRLEFIELLMEHGINMKLFLTVDRLEKLYSSEANSNLMESLLMGFSEVRRLSRRRKDVNDHDRHLSLPGVGAALVQMGVYRPDYLQMRSRVITNLDGAPNVDEEFIRDQKFQQPFDDLFLWAVLTKRHDLAKLLWTHGQAALAKALVASMLNNFFAVELARLNISLVKEFKNNKAEWNKLSLSLLDSCYRQDLRLARKLLTMELKNWSQQNCLILAVMADHKALLGHPSCQTLLADLWMGKFNLKSNSIYKIALATLFPPFSLFLQYKSTEELMVFSSPDNDDERHNRDNNDKHGLKLHEILIPDSESIRTVYPQKITESTSNTIRSRLKVGRRTNLSEIVSKLEFGKGSSSGQKFNEGGDADCSVKSDLIRTGSQRDRPFITIVGRKYTEYRYRNKGSSSNDRYKLEAEQSEKFSRFVTTHQNLTTCEKLIESQKAPITNFLRHFFGYLIFIVGLWYVCLYNQDPHHIGWVELYVTLCMFTQMVESVREFIFMEALTFSKKIAEMKENMLRLTDFFMVLLFICGTTIRFIDGYFQYGMVIYRASSMYWNLRIYKYLAVNRFVGPKLLMMIKMCHHMASFAMIILVVIFSFAIARESIRNPNKYPTWRDIKPSFLEPYVMMFGEMDSLQEAINVKCINDLTFSSDSPHCPMGSWMIPIFWVVYMMISNVLIVNVLIAVFNGIYAEIDSKSVEVWMSQQFTVVMEFSKKPLLPPPFIIISHAFLLFEFIIGKCQRCMCTEELLDPNEEDEQIRLIMGNDHNLKAFLDPAEQAIVFDFEEENVDLLRHVLTNTDKDVKPPQSTSQFSNAEAPHPRRVLTSEKFTFVAQLKNSLQKLYSEMENQRMKIDKLIEYREMELANQKDKEEAKQNDNEEDDDDDDTSTSSTDSSETIEVAQPEASNSKGKMNK